MKNPFSRRSVSSAIPDGVTEEWSAGDNAVLVRLAFVPDPRDDSATADRLSAAVVATVAAVQAGEFGHSIPEGARGAGVRIVVDTGTVALGPLANRHVEILQERLGVSIPLSVTTQDPPAVVEVEPADVPAAASPAAPARPAPAVTEPSPGLVAAPYLWDEENLRLRAEIVHLGPADDDAQTAADVRARVERTIAALGAPATQALVPTTAPVGYPVWLTVVVNDDAVGPLTEQLFEDGEAQFEDTRVDFVAMVEPRATVEEMLAGR